MLAHHDIVFLAQGGASIGLASWAAALGTRWYAITHRRSRRTVADLHTRHPEGERPK